MSDSEKIKIIEDTITSDGQIDLHSRFNDMSKPEMDRIISLVTGQGRYMLDKVPHTGVWVLRNDPNYSVREATKKTSIVQRRVLRTTIGVTIATLAIQCVNLSITISTQKKQKELEVQLQHLPPVRLEIDTVIVR